MDPTKEQILEGERSILIIALKAILEKSESHDHCLRMARTALEIVEEYEGG